MDQKNEYITVKESNERLLKYCKLLTITSKDEKWFNITHFLLNILVLLAITIFFERLFKYSKEETRRRCHDDNLHQNLSNVLIAFFIINIVAQVINILIKTFSETYFNSLTKDCTKLLEEEYQKQVYTKKKDFYSIALVIRIMLIIIVVVLLICGIVLWAKCNDNYKQDYRDVFIWYNYFKTPRKFIGADSNSPDILTIKYAYSQDVCFYLLANKNATQDKINKHLTDGNWYINEQGPFKYNGEFYDKNKSCLFLKPIHYNNPYPQYNIEHELCFNGQEFSIVFNDEIYTHAPILDDKNEIGHPLISLD